MKITYLAIAAVFMAAMAISGCTSPAPSPSPLPTATPEPTPAPTPTPEPTAVPTATPTPVPEYSNDSPVSVSHVRIDWDTTQFSGQAKQTATMTVKNTQSDSLVVDVNVLYTVSTPATFVDADGTVHNFTNPNKKTVHVGLMQAGEQRDVSVQVEHARNVPATVTIVLQWRGGSAAVFEKTLEIPDNSFGTYEF